MQNNSLMSLLNSILSTCTVAKKPVMHEAMCTCTQECVIVESHHIMNMHVQFMGFLMLERITCSGIAIQLCMHSVGKVNHDTLIQQVILILITTKIINCIVEGTHCSTSSYPYYYDSC